MICVVYRLRSSNIISNAVLTADMSYDDDTLLSTVHWARALVSALLKLGSDTLYAIRLTNAVTAVLEDLFQRYIS